MYTVWLFSVFGTFNVLFLVEVKFAYFILWAKHVMDAYITEFDSSGTELIALSIMLSNRQQVTVTILIFNSIGLLKQYAMYIFYGILD